MNYLNSTRIVDGYLKSLACNCLCSILNVALDSYPSGCESESYENFFAGRDRLILLLFALILVGVGGLYQWTCEQPTVTAHRWKQNTWQLWIIHRARRALMSDWSVNCFIMVVQNTTKNILIDNYFETIYRPVFLQGVIVNGHSDLLILTVRIADIIIGDLEEFSYWLGPCFDHDGPPRNRSREHEPLRNCIEMRQGKLVIHLQAYPEIGSTKMFIGKQFNMNTRFPFCEVNYYLIVYNMGFTYWVKNSYLIGPVFFHSTVKSKKIYHPQFRCDKVVISNLTVVFVFKSLVV